MTRFRASVVAAALVALACSVLPSTAAAARRADLRVTKAVPLTPTVVQKGRIRVSVTVRNSGKKRARASAAGLFLSKDRRRSKSDKRLGSLKIKALGKGKRATRKGRLKLPRSVKPGAYVLIACADVKRRVRERSERNNCKASKRKLGVTVRAKPVRVTPHLDKSHAADGLVTPGAGGSIGAFAADGTTFVLVVPPHAVTHAQRVALTPVTKIDGLPLSGGLVAAAQVGTASFQLAKAAKLVILRNNLAPSPSHVAFGYRGNGDLFLSPLGRRPAGYPAKSIVVPVLHGGGYGVGKGTASDVAKQRAKPPVHIEDRLSQTASGLGAVAKRTARVHASAFSDAEHAEALALYQQTIKPELQAAETNDALLNQASADAIEWMRETTLLGGEDEFAEQFKEITASIGRALDNAYDQAKKRCLNGDYGQVSQLISVERFKALLGYPSKTNLFEDVDKCLRFELRVTSHIEVHEDAGGGNTVDQVSELKSTVPLRLNLDNYALSGSAPFDYRLFNFSAVTHTPGQNCTLVGNSTETGTLHDGVLEVITGNVSAGDPGAPHTAPEVSLILDPGHPEEQIHSQYSGCSSSSSTQFETHWLDEWSVIFHLADSLGSDLGGYVISGFTPGAKPTVGTRHYAIVAGARTLDETWEVVHTPVP